jgi:hypothetical protein
MWRNCAWSKHVNCFCFQNCDSNIVEEKSRWKVCSASAEWRTESGWQEGHRRTAAVLRGRRWAVFEQNCCHIWNMDMNWNLGPLNGSMQILLAWKNVATNNPKLSSWWLWLMIRMEWWQQSASSIHCNSGILQEVSARHFVSKDPPKKACRIRSRCPHFAR